MSEVQQVERPADAAALAERFGLSRAGARPPLLSYIRALWERRQFIRSYSSANNAAGYSQSGLGQLWQVLTPLMNAAVYWLIFGGLLRTRKGVPNFAAYLIIGIFIFHFMTNVVTSSSKTMQRNVSLIRTLHFPRAVLPVSETLEGFQKLTVSLVVMIPIVMLTGEFPRLHWLLLVPTAILATMFILGVGLAVARLGAKVPDTSQFLPFILRTWLFASGVFFNIDKVSNHWINTLLHVQPGAVYLDLGRAAILHTHSAWKYDWIVGTGWAIFALVVGFVIFWLAEEEYGRG